MHFPIFGKKSLALASSDEKGNEHWKLVRNATNPAFKRGNLERSYIGDIVDEGNNFVKRLEDAANSQQPLSMAENLVEVTLDLILRVVLGKRDPILSQQVLQVLNEQLDHATSTGIKISLLEQYSPFARYREYSRVKRMFDLLSPSVNQHIEASRLGNIEDKQKKGVLDFALLHHPNFDVETLVDQVKTFVLAGHDTASSTLAWIYYHLSTSPSILAKLRDEHNRVFKPYNGFKTTIGNEGHIILSHPSILNELKYTLAVMRESLRLYPPASAIRKTENGAYTVISAQGKEYKVAGCMLWVNHWCLHRSKAIWGEDAAEFKPERWLNEDGSLVTPPTAWQPFSKGPKNCIGMELGLLEQKIILSMTVRKFDFAYAGQEEPYQKFRLTVSPPAL